MENIGKRIKIGVVKSAKDFIKYTSRPICVNWKVFENNLAAIHEKKISLTLNKQFVIKNFNTKLLFTDTYSFCYEIYGKKPHKKMYKYKELFDLSYLPLSS